MNNQKFKNVLIITYNFLPNSPTFGSVARCVYLYKYLKNQGFGVDVLSVRGKSFGYFGHEDLNPKDIHDVQSNLKVKKQEQFNTVKKNSYFKSLLKTVLLSLNENLIVPDYSIFSIFSIYFKSITLIERNNISSVIVSAPPHGLSLVLILLKRKKPNINFILEYRDSWNSQPIFKKHNYISNKISIFMERAVLKSINTLVYVSPAVPDLIKSELGLDVDNKSELIMNGYVSPTNLVYTNPPETQKCIKFAYFGVINDFQKSFRSIFVIDKLLSNSGLAVQLDLYGHIEFNKFDVTRSKVVNYLGSIDHKDVFNKTQEYNFLVILHTDEASSLEPIPGKFFDYLQARRPILCVMSKRSYISQFIALNGLGLVVDPLEISQFNFKYALDNFKFNSEFDISAYSRTNQFNKYITLLS